MEQDSNWHKKQGLELVEELGLKIDEICIENYGIKQRIAELTRRLHANDVKEQGYRTIILRTLKGINQNNHNVPGVGKFVCTTTPGGLVVQDEKAALEWAKQNAPATVRTDTTLSLKKSDFKALAWNHLNEYGEMPAGCVEKPDEFTLRVERE